MLGPLAITFSIEPKSSVVLPLGSICIFTPAPPAAFTCSAFNVTLFARNEPTTHGSNPVNGAAAAPEAAAGAREGAAAAGGALDAARPAVSLVRPTQSHADTNTSAYDRAP